MPPLFLTNKFDAKYADGYSATITVNTQKVGSNNISLWDDDGGLRITCIDNNCFEFAVNDLYANSLTGKNIHCGEVNKLTLFNYYLYDFTGSQAFEKYEDDDNIAITMYACDAGAIYNGGIVITECKTATVQRQHMGEQDDCSDIVINNCGYSLGQLYIGIKIRFSDGKEYWVKLDDRTIDGGKSLVCSECYLVGLYNTGNVYTTTTTRSVGKQKNYRTERYDVAITLFKDTGNLYYNGPQPSLLIYLDEPITFTDNFGHTYVIPLDATITYQNPYYLGRVSQGDRLWDEAQKHPLVGNGWQCSPLSTFWWNCPTPNFISNYYLEEETDTNIYYVRYELDIDQ